MLIYDIDIFFLTTVSNKSSNIEILQYSSFLEFYEIMSQLKYLPK